MNYYFSVSIHYHDGRICDDAYRPTSAEIAGEIVRILLSCGDDRMKAVIVDIRRTVNQEKAV